MLSTVKKFLLGVPSTSFTTGAWSFLNGLMVYGLGSWYREAFISQSLAVLFTVFIVSACITKIEHSLRDGNTCAFKFVHLYDYMYLAVSILLIHWKRIWREDTIMCIKEYKKNILNSVDSNSDYLQTNTDWHQESAYLRLPVCCVKPGETQENRRPASVH